MWQLADQVISSRLIMGSSQYASLEQLQQAVTTSQSQVITLSIGRQRTDLNAANTFWAAIKGLGCHVLPNTAGCRNAQEAIAMAEIARELFQTRWIKLEVIGDDLSLQPDLVELHKAATELNQRGFEVFPYCTDDLVVCQKLVDCGCRILMPGAAPIGSGKGLLNPFALETLRKRLPDTTLIIDAGIGKPSHALFAMELGFDGILLNTAIALARFPEKMAGAFRDAVHAGRVAYEAGIMPERDAGFPSTPLVDTPFWVQS